MTGKLVPARKGQSSLPLDVTIICRGFHCNTAGNLYVDFIDGGTNILLIVNAGQTYSYEISKIYTAGTTAAVIGLN